MDTMNFLIEQFVWQSKFLSKKIESTKSQEFFTAESELILSWLMLKKIEFLEVQPKEEIILTHLKNNLLSMPEPKDFTLAESFFKKSHSQNRSRKLFLDILESYDRRFMRGMQ